MEILLQLAGIALLMICVANGFAFRKLGWNENLPRTDYFFQQVFKVHTLHLVMMMFAMGLACLIATEELVAAETLMARGFLWFAGMFWGVRTLLHIFYYDPKVKRANPYWNALFLATFCYLAGTFLTLVIL